ncbi:diguanylate cyclase [Microbacterium sp. HD4P20]|uniref:sensor domain-containing diguanylate cyclase n=1 Tax=Microbacterium sp. HD4P20 TaxID=2864874 RepID=UPI001C6446FD|nr:sensor domain-containing diguanylate cyclase [Microbacterium sp. HD4P20]MCP2635828.1 diguanylate cyclase [Microbacterium sp. HD4P20]
MTHGPTRSAARNERERDRSEAQRLRECAAEPIRTIGRIQSHGVLFGIDPETSIIVLASDNAADWLGRRMEDARSDVLTWAVTHGVALDPVRAEFQGGVYDVIVHRETSPLLMELEPIVADLDYVRTGVVGAIQRLAAITDPDALREVAAAEIKTVTGFDRVMVYRFHDDGHGHVAADAREPDMEPYLGLHFPASDIPAQARALYLEKRSRAIVDTDDACLGLQSLIPDATVDLGPTELRAASPHHLQFMRNMGQASTVSFALVIDGRLSGMITCAHRTPRRLPVLLRRTLEVMASQLSLQLAAAENIAQLRRQLEARQRRAELIAPLYGRGHIARVLLGGDKSLLDVVPADGALVRIDGTTHTLGDVPPRAVLRRVLDSLGTEPFSSDALPMERPELAVEMPGVAGLLVVPLGEDNCIVFVRGEVARTIDWLGDQGPGNRDDALSPRRSFSAWRESVTGRSVPWGEHWHDAQELGAGIRAALAARAQAELAELALRDALTGLHNRRFLDEWLDELVESSHEGIGVVFIDLDDFKNVNDDFGHDAGDAVLAAVGRRLSGIARSTDVVARLGGDEFVMVCVDVDEAGANRIAGRAVESVSEPITVHGTQLRVTASAGVVVHTQASSAADLLSAADAAMYRAKRAGRGRVSG